MHEDKAFQYIAEADIHHRLMLHVTVGCIVSVNSKSDFRSQDTRLSLDKMSDLFFQASQLGLGEWSGGSFGPAVASCSDSRSNFLKSEKVEYCIWYTISGQSRIQQVVELYSVSGHM